MSDNEFKTSRNSVRIFTKK